MGHVNDLMIKTAFTSTNSNRNWVNQATCYAQEQQLLDQQRYSGHNATF